MTSSDPDRFPTPRPDNGDSDFGKRGDVGVTPETDKAPPPPPEDDE